MVDQSLRFSNVRIFIAVLVGPSPPEVILCNQTMYTLKSFKF